MVAMVVDNRREFSPVDHEILPGPTFIDKDSFLAETLVRMEDSKQVISG
jgi:hypothetical protein